jgi:hypothetical protein
VGCDVRGIRLWARLRGAVWDKLLGPSRLSLDGCCCLPVGLGQRQFGYPAVAHAKQLARRYGCAVWYWFVLQSDASTAVLLQLEGLSWASTHRLGRLTVYAPSGDA